MRVRNVCDRKEMHACVCEEEEMAQASVNTYNNESRKKMAATIPEDHKVHDWVQTFPKTPGPLQDFPNLRISWYTTQSGAGSAKYSEELRSS